MFAKIKQTFLPMVATLAALGMEGCVNAQELATLDGKAPVVLPVSLIM